MGKKDTDKGGVRMDKVIIRCRENIKPDELSNYSNTIHTLWDANRPIVLPVDFEVYVIKEDGQLFIDNDGNIRRV